MPHYREGSGTAPDFAPDHDTDSAKLACVTNIPLYRGLVLLYQEADYI